MDLHTWVIYLLAALGLDVEFVEHCVANLLHGFALLDLAPDVSAGRVQAVIDALFEIENDGFAAQFAGDLVWRDAHDRSKRDGRMLVGLTHGGTHRMRS